MSITLSLELTYLVFSAHVTRFFLIKLSDQGSQSIWRVGEILCGEELADYNVQEAVLLLKSEGKQINVLTDRFMIKCKTA